MNLPAELIRPVGRHLPSTSSHKWETYRRRRFGRFSRRRATSILRSVRTERATQKIGQSAIGPPGWLEKGLSASLLVRYVSQRIRSSLAPSIQTLLKPTVCLPLMRQCTSAKETVSISTGGVMLAKAKNGSIMSARNGLPSDSELACDEKAVYQDARWPAP